MTTEENFAYQAAKAAERAAPVFEREGWRWSDVPDERDLFHHILWLKGSMAPDSDWISSGRITVHRIGDIYRIAVDLNEPDEVFFGE